jgi:TRAP transporter TAXI family solute receptor
MAKEKVTWTTRRRQLVGFWHQAKFFLLGIVLLAASFAVAYQFVEPAPPSRVVIATGPENGAYNAFAKLYAERFADEGIELVPKPTVGSAENLRLLNDPDSGVDIAFVQGGIGTPDDYPDLESLGSLYYEPLWVFVRSTVPQGRLSLLAGKRIAIGVPGSGTRPVALAILGANGVTAQTATLLEIGADEATEALIAGAIDAAVFITAASSSTIRRLLSTPGIRLTSFGRAEAYTRLYRYLSAVVLPEGVIDLARDLPSHDIRLLAPAASLVAGPSLHPALAGLFLQVMHEMHRDGGLLEPPGAFPSAKFVTFPLAAQARRYYDNGPPLLQRYLPFWAANLADRLKIMLLPLITLLFPLFKILPPTYQWRMSSRINRMYKLLQALDDRIGAGVVSAPESLAELDRIEAAVMRLSIPASFADRVYHLRLHIDLLRRRLQVGP